jgi:hypothetical protein
VTFNESSRYVRPLLVDVAKTNFLPKIYVDEMSNEDRGEKASEKK